MAHEAHGKLDGKANGRPGSLVCRVPDVRHTTNRGVCCVFAMAHDKPVIFVISRHEHEICAHLSHIEPLRAIAGAKHICIGARACDLPLDKTTLD